MSRIRFFVLCIIFIVLLQACQQPTTPAPTPTITLTPTIDPATPAAATAFVEATYTQATANAQATLDAKLTADALAATQARVTEIAGKTATVAFQQTGTKDAYNATATQRVFVGQTKTAQEILEKTVQAQPMYDLVQQLLADGYISKADGFYTKLANFDESLNMINYYRRYLTGYSPKNYVITADIAWESASMSANWWNSGCGFAFNVDEEGNHFKAFLTLEGRIRFSITHAEEGYTTRIGQWFYGVVDVPKGGAKFTMVVIQQEGVRFFVNEKFIHYYATPLSLPPGELAYTINSGTNKDFGTRCKMTNVWLWEFSD